MESPVELAQGGRSGKPARQQLIAELVAKNGFAKVEDLAAILGVSRMTVHRDLDELHGTGAIRKVRGGATVYRSTQYESDLQFRQQANAKEKRRIARAAVSLASTGDVVIIDDSTSALETIPFLEPLHPLTIITNFVPAIERVLKYPGFSLIALGGLYTPKYASFLGIATEKALSDLRADILFTSSSSLLGRCVYHQDQEIVTAKRAMMAVAKTRVLVMDHTKLGEGALHKLCDVSEYTHMVTTTEADPRIVDEIRETGVEVLLAG